MEIHTKIEWTMDFPGTKITQDFPWQPLAQSPSQTIVEQDLNWPGGTIEILNQAFHKGLTRYTRWILPNHGDLRSYKKAAAVYKRGVTTSTTTTTRSSGSYLVRGMPSVSHCLGEEEQEAYIIDKNVYEKWPFLKKLNAFAIEMDESRKNLISVAGIRKWLEKNPPKTAVHIIGGGIVADTAAFACSLLGLPFCLIPTTLLSMVDACVGGKTGVNFPPFGKNQIGSFSFPCEVRVSTEWLKTLSERHFLSGLSECLKHGFLQGDNLLIAEINKLKAETITPDLVKKIIQIKAKIVAEDPAEYGRRATLNLGHTLAHALEKVAAEETNSANKITHGEAVAIGLYFQTYLSEFFRGDLISNQLQRATLRERQLIPSKDVLEERIGVPLTKALCNRLYLGIIHDKKSTGNSQTSNWIVLEKMGQVRTKKGKYTVEVNKEDFSKVWEKFINNYPS